MRIYVKVFVLCILGLSVTNKVYAGVTINLDMCNIGKVSRCIDPVTTKCPVKSISDTICERVYGQRWRCCQDKT
ncbi:unnamed protein product [Allacma fusca]|uniref:Uncharacterized protein n=1 Tax=Allacma fusca TaxID=39272 RepID=A0A8J2P8Y4_9HEXA|nr:unnamed protein product [Allacma fusca]